MRSSLVFASVKLTDFLFDSHTRLAAHLTDLPPLVEAPPCVDDDENGPPDQPDLAQEVRLASPTGFQVTFTRTMTPSFFGAPDASVSGLVSGAPSPSIPLRPPGLIIPSRTRAEEGRRPHGVSVDAPSPSNADVGSPSPSPALSPITPQTHGQGQLSTGARSSPSLALDYVREPASGPQRTARVGMGVGGGVLSPVAGGSIFVQGGNRMGAEGVAGPMMANTGAVRPPSYIPRPPNAFILFRASFVRTHKLGADGKAISTTPASGAGVSVLDPRVSVTTITPSASPGETTGRKGRGVAGKGDKGGDGSGGGSTATLSKLAGQLWRSLPPHERAVWEEKARTAQAEHRKKYPDWRFRPENASGVGVLGADDWGGGGGGTGGGGGAMIGGKGGAWTVLGAAGASYGYGRIKGTGGGGQKKKGRAGPSKAATELGLPSWATENMGFEEDKEKKGDVEAGTSEGGAVGSKSDAGVYGRRGAEQHQQPQAKLSLSRSTSNSASSSRNAKGKGRHTRSESRAHANYSETSNLQHPSSSAISIPTSVSRRGHPVASSEAGAASIPGSGDGSGASSATIRPPPSSRCSPSTTHSELRNQQTERGENASVQSANDNITSISANDNTLSVRSDSVQDQPQRSNSWMATIPLTAIAQRSESASTPGTAPTGNIQILTSLPDAAQNYSGRPASAQQSPDSESTQSIPPLISSAPYHFFPRGGSRILANEFEFGGDFFNGRPGSPAPSLGLSRQQQHQQQRGRGSSGVVRTNSHSRTRSATGAGVGAGAGNGRLRRAQYTQTPLQAQSQVKNQTPMQAPLIQTQFQRHSEQAASPPPISPALSSPISGGSSSQYSFGHAHAHSVGQGQQVFQMHGQGIISPSSHSNPSIGTNIFAVPSRFPPPPPRASPQSPFSTGRRSQNADAREGQMVSSGSASTQQIPYTAPVERIDASTLGYDVSPTLLSSYDYGFGQGGRTTEYSEPTNWDGSQAQPLSQSCQAQGQFATSPVEPVAMQVQGQQPQGTQASPIQPTDPSQAQLQGASTISDFVNSGPSGSSISAQPTFFHHIAPFSFSHNFNYNSNYNFQPFSLGVGTPSTSSSLSPNIRANPNVGAMSGSFNPFDPTGFTSGNEGLAYSPTVEPSSSPSHEQRFGVSASTSYGSGGAGARIGINTGYATSDTTTSSYTNNNNSNSFNTSTSPSSHSPFPPASLQDFYPYYTSDGLAVNAGEGLFDSTWSLPVGLAPAIDPNAGHMHVHGGEMGMGGTQDGAEKKG